MTYEEAWAHTQKEVDAYALKIKNGAKFYQKIADYYKLVLNALRKQIPTKPLPDVNFGFKGICPNCRARFIDDTTKYCGNCGQALDWSVSE